ncbi:CLUMA_CG007050, isoform A [Clunio marinus]|uniref:CLUMA_CG007050, isoform A n=1 Tax=Clunio marinus TaxID=568069 RepID=A0A1J1HZR5_9DIPT|nr:CLUMA_CG007050, isoform A [Clunio marinus]
MKSIYFAWIIFTRKGKRDDIGQWLNIYRLFPRLTVRYKLRLKLKLNKKLLRATVLKLSIQIIAKLQENS